MAKQMVSNDPNLAYPGRWAIPSLLRQRWAGVSVALQRANAVAVLASIGEVQGPGHWSSAGAADSYELLLQREGVEA